MTAKNIEMTDEIDQTDPVGYFVFSASDTQQDYKIFADLFEAENYAADQQEEAEADGWPIYPLFAGQALDHVSGENTMSNESETRVSLTAFLSCCAASVTWVIQYRSDSGRWVDRDDYPASDEDIGRGNVRYLRTQISAPLRLVKRVQVDSVVG